MKLRGFTLLSNAVILFVSFGSTHADPGGLPSASPMLLANPYWNAEMDGAACIEEIQSGMTLADIGLKIMGPQLEKHGSKLELISNKEITLKDETQAYRFEIKWLWANGITWYNTIGVGAFKNNKCVVLAAHPVEGHPTDVAWIVESLVFKRK